jgi:hypothetical protein
MATRHKAPTLEELERRAAESRVPGVAFVTDEEAFAMFDEAVQKYLRMSAEEFIERWNAGEYDEVFDKPGYEDLTYLAGFIPSLVYPNS